MNLIEEKNDRHQIHKLTFILLIFLFVVGFLTNLQNFTVLIALFALVVFGFVSDCSIKSKNLTGILFSFYYLVAVIIQLIFSIISPKAIQTVLFNKEYGIWLFNETSLVLRYVLLGTFFYLYSVFLSNIVKHSVLLKIELIKGAKTTRFTIVFFIIYIILYILSVPLHIGIIDFGLRGLGIVLFGSLIVKNYKDEITIKKIIKSGLYLSMYAIPGLWYGRRNPLILGGLMIILYLFILKWYEIKLLLSKHRLFLVLSITMFLLLFGLINISKFGEFKTISLFVKRVTGLYDGTVVLKYLETNKTSLGFSNYFKCVYNDSGMRANIYYTKKILGFSPEGTAFAAPIFIISLLYGGGGWVIISTFFALLLSFFCCRAKKLGIRLKKRGYNYCDSIKLFIYIQAIVDTIMQYIFDGNIEILKVYSITVFAFFLISLTSFIPGERRINAYN